MRLWDVNLWVYAFRADSPMHELVHGLLQSSLEQREPFLFCPMIAASFLRLVTNQRIFKQPSLLHEAWTFIDHLEAQPAAVLVDVDAMAFGIFKHLSLIAQVAGNDVTDAFLAALALRHDARLVTADAGFKRFQNLDVMIVN